MRTLFSAILILGTGSALSLYPQSSELDHPETVPPVMESLESSSPAETETGLAETSAAEPDSTADVDGSTAIAPDAGSSDPTESPVPPIDDDEPASQPAPEGEKAAEPSAVSPTPPTTQPATPATPAPNPPIVVQVANDEMMSRMEVMEQFVVAQHEREIALYRDTIRLVIVFGVGFAVVAGLGLLAACFLNYRAIIAVQAVVLRRTVDPEEPAVGGLLPQSSASVPGIERVQASGTRFQSRMSKLEDRLNELEHMTGHDSGNELAALHSELADESGETEPPQIETPPPRRVIPRAAIMVHKAQALMNLGKYSEALTTLDEAATFDGPNSEVQLARGQALEKLGRIPDAIEAYDRAVDIDQTNTNALLMKAGALNRQEKFTEALECYERALEVHRAVS